MEGIMLRVEHLDPILRERNGRYGWYSPEIAQRGARRGKWKILDSGHLGEVRDGNTRVLEAGGSGTYLVKGAFSKEPLAEDRVTLGHSDLYGEKETK